MRPAPCSNTGLCSYSSMAGSRSRSITRTATAATIGLPTWKRPRRDNRRATGGSQGQVLRKSLIFQRSHHRSHGWGRRFNPYSAHHLSLGNHWTFCPAANLPGCGNLPQKTRTGRHRRGKTGGSGATVPAMFNPTNRKSAATPAGSGAWRWGWRSNLGRTGSRWPFRPF